MENKHWYPLQTSAVFSSNIIISSFLLPTPREKEEVEDGSGKKIFGGGNRMVRFSLDILSVLLSNSIIMRELLVPTIHLGKGSKEFTAQIMCKHSPRTRGDAKNIQLFSKRWLRIHRNKQTNHKSQVSSFGLFAFLTFFLLVVYPVYRGC